jgi:LuxR family maltose regulon positive regulatory protein
MVIPELHHRAALWHEEHGSGAECHPACFSCDGLRYAACLVEYSANTLVYNEGFTPFQWMNAIPDQEIQSRPRFNLFKALVPCMMLTSRKRICLDSVIEWFNENWNPDEPDRYLAETRRIVAALRSSVYANLGDASLAVSEANCALELLPENNSIWRGIAFMCLGFAHEVAGNEEQVNQAITRADITIRNAQNTAYSLLVIYNLGAIQLMRGLLHEASEYYKQVISLADQYKAERLHELGESKVDLAWVLCEWDDLPAAEEQLNQGLEIGRQIDSFLIQITGHLVYARILQAQGNEKVYLTQLQARQMAETNQILIHAEPAGSSKHVSIYYPGTRNGLACEAQAR